MANSGYIIVKGGDGRKAEDRRTYRQFYSPIDKGSSKPSFCYPRRKADLEEEVRSMEKSLEMGNVSGDRRLQFESSLKQKRDRLDAINEGHESAKKLLNQDKDAWVERRKKLADEISSGMPSISEERNRKVNPYKIIKNEKEGLGEMKKEYIVLSRLLEEESNVGFLQRD